MFGYTRQFNQNLCVWDMSGASDTYKFCEGANCVPDVGCHELLSINP